MSRFYGRFVRKCSPWLGAGVLLQAGGCTVDINSLAAGLTQSIINTIVADFIFGIFNVGAF